ncbi:hypothetical protein [Ensifer aridi]|uniref:hypothetical protein n=1 Tax=Ensifer aridi TaxID=1708715 RepID=UPI001124E56C|nr:hypothetical protein [Ensifer aridi]
MNDHQRAGFAQAIEGCPTPYRDDSSVAFFVIWISGCGRNSACRRGEQTLSREVRSMGYGKLSARPRHRAQDIDTAETFKKNPPPL